ncbi:PepSY domain-containing protein [Virgibacillus salinus]|uniref:Peptidase propeptide and YPEB domain-containing protein n=1 Tax=Virgibacillus salinus TaxID=553311 RepID=A0A1H1FY23_9BACI|nr:PepSY domain-containing protein [Virgibacillus salinus]SDR05862.1 Peptidase propeptide and YPEB domain-containing protein [Virgibacillus salinus]
MKKKIGIALAVFIGATAMGLGIYHSDAAQAEPKLSTEEIEQLVKDQYPGEITEMELEKSRNRAVYEIEIHDGQKEYEIKMDGNTGEVLKLEETMIASDVKQSNEVNIDDNKDDNKSTNNSNVDDKKVEKDDNRDDDTKELAIKEKDDSTKDDKNQQTKTDDDKSKVGKVVIDIDKAKEIALSAFSGTIVSIELDEDDGRLLYEMEMDTNKREAEIEIDAYTGEVLVLDIESKDSDDAANDSNDNYDDSDDSADNDNDADADDDDTDDDD